jgi:hypothetical protein
MGTGESWPLSFDFSPAMAPGDTVSLPTYSLVDVTGRSDPGQGTAVTFTATPMISGNVVTIMVSGSSLAAGDEYLLLVGATLATGKKVVMGLTIKVPL